MGLVNGNTSCFEFSIKKCNGACINSEPAEDYNDRARELIQKNSFADQNMIVVDRGRSINEQSLVLIENGKFKGIGYFTLNHQIQKIDILRSIITPMSHNRDTQHIIQSYIRQHKKLKLIPLSFDE